MTASCCLSDWRRNHKGPDLHWDEAVEDRQSFSADLVIYFMNADFKMTQLFDVAKQFFDNKQNNNN